MRDRFAIAWWNGGEAALITALRSSRAMRDSFAIAWLRGGEAC